MVSLTEKEQSKCSQRSSATRYHVSRHSISITMVSQVPIMKSFRRIKQRYIGNRSLKELNVHGIMAFEYNESVKNQADRNKLKLDTRTIEYINILYFALKSNF